MMCCGVLLGLTPNLPGWSRSSPQTKRTWKSLRCPLASLSPDGADTTEPAPATPDDAALWTGTDRTRRLTDHGKQILIDMNQAGAATTDIAVRFGVTWQNVARMLRALEGD
ncbi:MAG: hypothetical protein HQL37_16480 [Alphaproteobacteria bacterium]|nr:hypothetical protein [Alphaproteobacteria bacterium]